MNDKVEVLIEGLKFPEGPVFDEKGELWFVEIKGGTLNCWNSGNRIKYDTGGAPNGLTFTNNEKILICDSGQNKLLSFNTLDEQFKTIVDNINGDTLDEPNDLAFDAKGNLLFTCPGNSRQEPTGYVCCLTKNGLLKKVITDKYFPNGICFTDEGNTLVLAETYRHRLWKGNWNADDCNWVEPEPWVEVGGPIGPDGMALGEDGLLYVAVFDTGTIKAVSPMGEIVEVFQLPGNRPTNVAFDPSGELGLVVTEAEKGLLCSIPELGSGVPLFKGEIN